MADGPADRRGSRVARRRAAALAAALTFTAAVATGCAANSTDAGAGGPVSQSRSQAAASTPERITIPAIHVSAALDPIGLDAAGGLETPAYNRPMDAAWYEQGPRPGERGTAIIAGHLDTPRKPQAVFYRLGELTRNQEIDIRREDGSTVVFLVDSVSTFKKNAFPSERVYAAADRPELRLITCGGSLTAARHWDANVVVFAHLKG